MLEYTYVYKSEYHISRSELIKNKFNSYVVMFLERLLFYGSQHFKRGQGCVILPHERNRYVSTSNFIGKRKKNI